MVAFVRALKNKRYEVIVFSCKRQLNESVLADGTILEEALKKEKVTLFSVKDINRNPDIQKYIDRNTLGLGLGECWSFSRELIDMFGGKLLDFMGIRLPQYRGGAHYTWQILRKDKIGSCNLQIINEEMVPAKFDSGAIVKSKEYVHPESVRIPQDYFDSAVKQECQFLLGFLDEVDNGKEFELTYLQEELSMFFPRLYTKKHGFINWEWRTEDIEIFICAFDDPYPGASTFLNDRRVFLKKCSVGYCDGTFHPFQSGLVYRKHNGCCYVATSNGTLVVKSVIDEYGKSIIDHIELGQRFYTPYKYLDESMIYNAEYNSDGIKE